LSLYPTAATARHLWVALRWSSPALEAQWVARRIRDLVAGGAADFSEVAVLVRNVQALPPFEEVFHAFDVPYVLARGKRFYEAQQIADMTHWLRVLVNARDEISLAAVLRSPLAGVSDETLVRLKQRGHLAEGLAQCEECAELDPGDRKRLVWLREALRGSGGEDASVRIRCVREPPERPARRAPALVEEREERLARPALSGQYGSSVAVTSVALFQECPRQYFLARYLGWPQARLAPLLPEEERDETGPDAAELGRQVHDLLAGLEVRDAGPVAVELAARFQSSDLAERVARAARVEREFDFLLEVEEVVIHGRIDLWFEEGGELVLVDYKTDDVPAAEAAAHAQSYAPQLQLYALALERLTGRQPDRALIYLLRRDLQVPVSLRREDLESARAAVRTLRRAQEELHFPVRTGAHCTRCAYYAGLCPARATA